MLVVWACPWFGGKRILTFQLFVAWESATNLRWAPQTWPNLHLTLSENRFSTFTSRRACVVYASFGCCDRNSTHWVIDIDDTSCDSMWSHASSSSHSPFSVSPPEPPTNHEQLRGFSEWTMSVPTYHPLLVYIDLEIVLRLYYHFSGDRHRSEGPRDYPELALKRFLPPE